MDDSMILDMVVQLEPLVELPEIVGDYWFWPDSSENNYYLVAVLWPKSRECFYAYPVNYSGVKDKDGRAEYRGCLPLHRVESGKWYGPLPTPRKPEQSSRNP